MRWKRSWRGALARSISRRCSCCCLSRFTSCRDGAGALGSTRGAADTLAAVPRQPALTGFSRSGCPNRSARAVDVRGGRVGRVLGGHRGRRRLRRHAEGRAGRRRLSATGARAGATRRRSPIGESSPAVARGTVFVGDLAGAVHAVSARDGQRVWTFKTGGEMKSSPVVRGQRVLVGSYDGHLYCLAAASGKRLVEGEDGRQPCTRPRRWPTASPTSRAATRSCAPCASPTGGRFPGQLGRVHRRVARAAGGQRLLRHLQQRRARRQPRRAAGRLALPEPGAAVPVLLLGGGHRRARRRRRARQGRPLPRRRHGQRVTGRSRRRRASIPRRPSPRDRVFVGSNDGRLYVLDFFSGRKVAEFNLGAPGLGLARRRLGPRRRRLAGRAALLLRVTAVSC